MMKNNNTQTNERNYSKFNEIRNSNRKECIVVAIYRLIDEILFYRYFRII